MLLFYSTLTTTSTTTATRTISKLRLTIRCFSSTSVHTSSTKWPALPVLTDSSPASFRKTAFLPARPFKLPRAAFTLPLPAIEKWFSRANASSSISGTSSPSSPSPETATNNDNNDESIPISIPNYTYLDPFASTTILPLELITDDNESNDSGDSLSLKKFTRASAPLAIWLSWSKLVLLHQNPLYPSTTTASPPNLYISQSPLSLLPPTLQSDLPTPKFILTAGKGDIYDSSLWMGVPPTYTPLHRDGNPNVLCQLVGGKKVRLMEPDYDDDDDGIGRRGRGGIGRGMDESAMQGDERMRMEKLVWGDDHDDDHDHDQHWQGDRKGQGDKTGEKKGKGKKKERYEVDLQPGEAVFIPTGWWHSVKGTGRGVTASVNWWFR